MASSATSYQIKFQVPNYCLVPIISKILGVDIAPLELPAHFWYGWSGIVATWSIGRSAEKRGASSQLTRTIIGSPGSKLLGEDTPMG